MINQYFPQNSLSYLSHQLIPVIMKQITPKKTLMTLMMSFVVLASSCQKYVQNETHKVADYSVTIIPETKL